MESGVTDFSPEMRFLLVAAWYLLAAARRYRKNRYGAVLPDDTAPVPLEDEAWMHDKEGVLALVAASGGEWPEEIEWPDDEEPLPPSERRISKQLVSGTHGTLNFQIWKSSSGDIQHQRPTQPRRPRPPRVLPGGSPALLLTVFREPPARLPAPAAERWAVTQRIQVRAQVADKARRQGDKGRRAAFTGLAQTIYNMSSSAIRKRINRGPRTPEGTPDWDILEAQLACRGRQATPSEVSKDMIEDMIEAEEERLRRAETEDERIDSLDKLRQLRQMRGETNP